MLRLFLMNNCFSGIYRTFILYFVLLDDDVRERRNAVYFFDFFKISTNFV